MFRNKSNAENLTGENIYVNHCGNDDDNDDTNLDRLCKRSKPPHYSEPNVSI